MVILGHPDIPFEPLYFVESLEEIERTPPNATLWLGAWQEAKELAKHCSAQRLPFAVMAQNATEAALANALGARYILAEFTLAESLQKLADHYLFDAKIVVPIHQEEEMASALASGIDGVIFQDAIKWVEQP